jgi:hypothetical protein
MLSVARELAELAFLPWRENACRQQNEPGESKAKMLSVSLHQTTRHKMDVKILQNLIGRSGCGATLNLGDEHIVENLLPVPRLHSSNYRGLVRRVTSYRQKILNVINIVCFQINN